MSLNRLLVFLIVLSSIWFGNKASNAQKVVSIDPESGLQVSTGIGFGFAGPKYFMNFKLVDELGLAYDIASLIRDKSLRESINLSDEQVKEILQRNKTVTSEMKIQLAAALASNQGKEVVEQQFLDLQAELRDIMDAEQLLLLEQVKNQRGIEQFGLSSFLGTSAMRDELALSDSDLESLRGNESKARKEHENRIEDLLQQANKSLIKELTEDKQAAFAELMKGKSLDEYLKTPMFVTGESLKRRKTSSHKTLLGLLRSEKVRKQIELTEDQYDLAMVLKNERGVDQSAIKAKLKNILDPIQQHQLNAIGINAEATRFGTVNALSQGLLRNLLDLSSDESAQVYAAGKMISKELAESISKSELEVRLASLASLPAVKSERIAELIGKSTDKLVR